MDRFGGSASMEKASASSTTAMVPDPSSSAPFRMLSPASLGWPTPTWSMWPLNTMYSFFSSGSLPSRIPTVFGISNPSSSWITVVTVISRPGTSMRAAPRQPMAMTWASWIPWDRQEEAPDCSAGCSAWPGRRPERPTRE